jgi:hypothetical protein
MSSNMHGEPIPFAQWPTICFCNYARKPTLCNEPALQPNKASHSPTVTATVFAANAVWMHQQSIPQLAHQGTLRAFTTCTLPPKSNASPGNASDLGPSCQLPLQCSHIWSRPRTSRITVWSSSSVSPHPDSTLDQETC